MKKRVSVYHRVATEAQLGLEAKVKEQIEEHPELELWKIYSDSAGCQKRGIFLSSSCKK